MHVCAKNLNVFVCIFLNKYFNLIFKYNIHTNIQYPDAHHSEFVVVINSAHFNIMHECVLANALKHSPKSGGQEDKWDLCFCLYYN